MQVGAEHDDRPPRDLRRRRHGPGGAHRDRRASGTARRRHATSTRWLRGVALRAGAEARARRRSTQLNTWYYADAPRTVQPQLELARRQSTFDEVVGGLDESNALFEARRCLSCGNCFSCDNCYGVCPDNAVLKLGGPGETLRDRPRLLQGLRHLRRRVPVRRDRDGAGGDLDGDGPHRATAAHGAAPSSIDRARRGRLSTLPARHEPPVPRAWDAGGL